MITAPTFIFYLSDTMQSYPLHTHNVVLFLVSSWKQMFSVRRDVSVAVGVKTGGSRIGGSELCV